MNNGLPIIAYRPPSRAPRPRPPSRRCDRFAALGCFRWLREALRRPNPMIDSGFSRMINRIRPARRRRRRRQAKVFLAGLNFEVR